MPYKPDMPEYNLARLNDQQKNVALLLIRGLTNKAIADLTGLSEIAIANYKRSTIFQAYWRSVRSRVEDEVISNERMVNDLIPKILELNHKLVDKALNDEMIDRDAINLSKHWTKPYVELPGEGSLLSHDELKELQRRAQAPYFKDKQEDIIDVEIVPYQGVDDDKGNGESVELLETNVPFEQTVKESEISDQSEQHIPAEANVDWSSF